MGAKQNTPQKKKEGIITRSDRNASNRAVEIMLEEHKSKIGDVVLVVIDDRTTIELPSNLSQAEREARIANYKKTHKFKK